MSFSIRVVAWHTQGTHMRCGTHLLRRFRGGSASMISRPCRDRLTSPVFARSDQGFEVVDIWRNSSEHGKQETSHRRTRRRERSCVFGEVRNPRRGGLVAQGIANAASLTDILSNQKHKSSTQFMHGLCDVTCPATTTNIYSKNTGCFQM